MEYKSKDKMDIDPVSSMSCQENETKLLFLETFSYPQSQYNIEEIFFSKAISLHQIRILKTDSNPHTKIKSMQSKTQSASIYNFDIFARNLKKPSDKFEKVVDNEVINKENGETDSIFPFTSEFVTNHIVIRGTFERITMCIYGAPLNGSDNHLLLENAKNEISIEKLNELQRETNEDKNETVSPLSNEEISLANEMTIDSLMSSHVKYETSMKRSYSINKPNVTMVDKTKSGYIYYEDDLMKYAEKINSFYKAKKIMNTAMIDENEIIEVTKCYKMFFQIFKILIKKNLVFQEDECVFRNENLQIFNSIPDIIITFTIEALNGEYFGYTETKYGLMLLKYISNSKVLVDKFVLLNGIESLFAIIVGKNDNDNEVTTNEIRKLGLECVYKLSSFPSAFERITENFDKKKFPQSYYMIKESSSSIGLTIKEEKEEETEKDEKKKKKEKEKEKDKKHKKKHHSHSSKKSRSRSRSRSLSKERKSKKDEKSNKDDSSSSSDKKKSKKKQKNIPLKNGYQILSTLLLNKKNTQLASLIKNIINKLSLMLYMKNLNTTVNTLFSHNDFINVDFDKLIMQLNEIFNLLSSLPSSISKEDQEDDYPYKYIYNTFITTDRKFYKKLNQNNEECISCNVITNEIAYLIEAYSLLSNIILLISNPQAMIMPQFFDIAMSIKNIITYIALSKSGINFLSKNFDITLNLINLIDIMTKDIVDTIDEHNLFSLSLLKSMNKSNFEYCKFSKINDVLIHSASISNITDDFIIKLHFLQLKYFIIHSFNILSSIDDLVALHEKNEDNDDSETNISDKTLSILIALSDISSKSNLSKQAMISLSQNDYFIGELFILLKSYSDDIDRVSDHEGHIAVIIDILRCLYTNEDSKSDILFLKTAAMTNELLTSLKSKMQNEYDRNDTEPINEKLFDSIDTMITLTNPMIQFESSNEIKNLVSSLSTALFNNIQKYNMNDTLSMPNIKDTKLREYLDEYKMNIKKYDNNDSDYLESFKSKGSLINEIYAAMKIINFSIHINPLLLIDCVCEHIHLALRYIIVNSVNALSDVLGDKVAIKDDNEDNKKNSLDDTFDIVCINCSVLQYAMKILATLLSNLLSSHVDNYRDTIVIEKIVDCIVLCVNYLFDIYSDENTNDIINENVESVQKLFEASLLAFREICKFNTTIQLFFKKLIDKLIDKPCNKMGMIFVFNFMLSNVNSEYTVEAFVEHLAKVQNKQSLDLFNEIENNLSTVIKYSDFIDGDNIVKYIVEVASTTNNDFLVMQCANVLLFIYKRYNGKNKLTVYEEITQVVIDKLNTVFNKISKFNFFLLEAKDLDNLLPDFEALIRILKFAILFIKSDYKFLFIFHDIAVVYNKIFAHFKPYLLQNDFNVSLQNDPHCYLRDVIFDISFLLLEGLSVLCDSKRSISSKFLYENNARYDLVEELPNKEHIVAIVKELTSFINTFVTIPPEGNDISVNKVTILVTKAINIFSSLASNSYGQNILLSKEYAQNGIPNTPLSKEPTPMISLKEIINKVLLAQQKGIKNESFRGLIESIAKLMFVLLYDLNYYENISLSSKGQNEAKLMTITSIRLKALIRIVSSDLDASMQYKDMMILISTSLQTIMSLLIYFNDGDSDVLLFEIGKLKGLIDNYPNNIDVLDIEVKSNKLPNSRKIDEKFELINRYYEYYKVQPYGINFPLEITKDNIQTSMTISSSLFNVNYTMNLNTNNNLMNVDHKNQINEFEKLLNWKKHRIYLSRENNLNVRRNVFDLDYCINSLDKTFIFNEFDFFNLRKKYFYFNTDHFEQYCNFIFNENIIFKSFSNISYAITSTVNNKIYILSDQYEYTPQLKNFFLKSLTKSKINLSKFTDIKDNNNVNLLLSQNQSILHKLRKKINSKLNILIYKPNYEKNASTNKTIINPIANNINKEQIRCLSKVSGRNLSTHVDNVVPGQKVVNLTYAGVPTPAVPAIPLTPAGQNNTEEKTTENKPAQPQVPQSAPQAQTTPMQIDKTPNTAEPNTTMQNNVASPAPFQPGKQPNSQPPLAHPNMMKMPQPFGFPPMNYPSNFMPGQPNMMMNPMMSQNFAGMNPGMYPQYQQFSSMMPIPTMMGMQSMNNPTQNQPQPQQQPQPAPAENKPPVQSSNNNPNQQQNMVNNLRNILLNIKQSNSGTSNQGGNEASKDPRIRKKK